jgi:hypothetical protein
MADPELAFSRLVVKLVISPSKFLTAWRKRLST